jgi:hypothetical protein
MKKYIIGGVIVILVVGYFILSPKKAEASDINDVINTVEAVPTKVVNFVSNEVDKTKEFQKANWAELKFKWKGFKEKFLSE